VSDISKLGADVLVRACVSGGELEELFFVAAKTTRRIHSFLHTILTDVEDYF